MPRLSRFYGIAIAMYYNDHAPPHFHAKYEENEASIQIETLDYPRGNASAASLLIVLEWAGQHRPELRENWARAREGVPLVAIEPLE